MRRADALSADSSVTTAPARAGGGEAHPRWIGAAVWAFVGLGVFFRVARYALNYPLWCDEAFVAANFVTRDYLGLLRPLDYGQICPPLFLWAERAAVTLLGFSEWTLRLVPLLCGVAGLLLFRRAAGLVTGGLPLLLAVAVFAVSGQPIRCCAQVKPYSADLLAALMLITPALAWLKDRSSTRRLWLLAALVPLTQWLSHPAVFVAGGVSLALAGAVWRTGNRRAVAAFVAFNVALVAAFGVQYVFMMRPQAAQMSAWRNAYWGGGFPPWRRPLALVGWLAEAHTGKMLAYPTGGGHGASTPAFLLLLAGAAVLWRRRDTPVLLLLLAPFGLTFIAAALEKYPYGVDSRQMQYVAPAVCLLMGLGAAALVRAVPPPRWRAATVGALLAALPLGAAVTLAHDVRRPYTADYDVKSRDFARAFWPGLARDAEVACLTRDFNVCDRDFLNMYMSYHLCNQSVWRPTGLAGPRWGAVSATRPLRCVLYGGTGAGHPEVQAWLAAMWRRYELRRVDERVFDQTVPGGRPLLERVVVFEFVPRPGEAVARSAPEGAVRR